MFSLSVQRLHVTNGEPRFTKSSEQYKAKKAILRVKLKKALQYCDFKKDSELSPACIDLWDEIDKLSVELNNNKFE